MSRWEAWLTFQGQPISQCSLGCLSLWSFICEGYPNKTVRLHEHVCVFGYSEAISRTSSCLLSSEAQRWLFKSRPRKLRGVIAGSRSVRYSRLDLHLDQISAVYGVLRGHLFLESLRPGFILLDKPETSPFFPFLSFFCSNKKLILWNRLLEYNFMVLWSPWWDRPSFLWIFFFHLQRLCSVLGIFYSFFWWCCIQKANGISNIQRPYVW